ncbi:hypothetical protein [Thalassospira mesophila]|uniref:hypothetical protein n=1 Tax=Thalassospira mesophila TaxID=1293891 RepID=UPI0011808883|nr:hypothetical protein [Thalassospira mesophila]
MKQQRFTVTNFNFFFFHMSSLMLAWWVRKAVSPANRLWDCLREVRNKSGFRTLVKGPVDEKSNFPNLFHMLRRSILKKSARPDPVFTGVFHRKRRSDLRNAFGCLLRFIAMDWIFAPIF